MRATTSSVPGPTAARRSSPSRGALAPVARWGGQLEESNVDLSREFIGLILAQTGYTANARVIRTTDELLQQLVVLGLVSAA
ncbi:MAG: hypothetical protein KatS3mg103_0193 [Phycisphaerales bacterium]|nr:MAG: hypothetical protein KatS3mg103_0193 [Phycisphaerales bacterium]